LWIVPFVVLALGYLTNNVVQLNNEIYTHLTFYLFADAWRVNSHDRFCRGRNGPHEVRHSQFLKIPIKVFTGVKVVSPGDERFWMFKRRKFRQITRLSDQFRCDRRHWQIVKTGIRIRVRLKIKTNLIKLLLKFLIQNRFFNRRKLFVKVKYLLLSLCIIINRGQFTPGKGKTDIIYCCRDYSLRQNPCRWSKNKWYWCRHDTCGVTYKIQGLLQEMGGPGGGPKLSLTMWIFLGFWSFLSLPAAIQEMAHKNKYPRKWS